MGSAAAVTETGSLVFASASGSQLAGYAGAARAIWVVGAQKVVPDLSTALRRVEDHCLPLESERAMEAYGGPVPSTACSSSTRSPARPRHRPAAPRGHRILRPPAPPGRAAQPCAGCGRVLLRGAGVASWR